MPYILRHYQSDRGSHAHTVSRHGTARILNAAQNCKWVTSATVLTQSGLEQVIASVLGNPSVPWTGAESYC